MTSLELSKVPNRRKSYDERTGRNKGAARVAAKALSGYFDRKYEEDEHGDRIRVFGKGEARRITNDDIREWLLGKRVTDVTEAREFVTEAAFKWCERHGYIRKDSAGLPRWWVTRKAADELKLPRVLNCKFPR
jgi:hypothetical protein